MPVVPALADALQLALNFNTGDPNKPPRVPLVLSCSYWRNRNIPPLQLSINPHSVGFKQAKRITKKNTQGGTAYFHWSNNQGQNNDILTLDLRGRSGNIRTASISAAAGTLGGFQAGLSALTSSFQNIGQFATQALGSVNIFQDNKMKHFNFARLLNLTQTPVVDPLTGAAGTFEIMYRSVIIPQPIQFIGFYNNVLEFTETAESPFMVEWSVSFVVQRTNPPIEQLSQYLSAILSSPGAAQANLTAQLGPQQPQLIGPNSF